MNVAGRAGAVIVAAGQGTRLGTGIPKALVTLRGEALVTHAVHAAAAASSVDALVVVAPSGHEDAFAAAVPAGTTLVTGGTERTDSVRAGIAALDESIRIVLVHDAARPLAPAGLFDAVTARVAAGADAVVPGLEVTDTVKQIDGYGNITATLDRGSLRAVQTPQGFERRSLEHAHRAGDSATDDAALVERCGGHAVVIAGDPLAMKVTTPDDLTRIGELAGHAEPPASGTGGRP